MRAVCAAGRRLPVSKAVACVRGSRRGWARVQRRPQTRATEGREPVRWHWRGWARAWRRTAALMGANARTLRQHAAQSVPA